MLPPSKSFLMCIIHDPSATDCWSKSTIKKTVFRRLISPVCWRYLKYEMKSKSSKKSFWKSPSSSYLLKMLRCVLFDFMTLQTHFHLSIKDNCLGSHVSSNRDINLQFSVYKFCCNNSCIYPWSSINTRICLIPNGSKIPIDRLIENMLHIGHTSTKFLTYAFFFSRDWCSRQHSGKRRRH